MKFNKQKNKMDLNNRKMTNHPLSPNCGNIKQKYLQENLMRQIYKELEFQNMTFKNVVVVCYTTEFYKGPGTQQVYA